MRQVGKGSPRHLFSAVAVSPEGVHHLYGTLDALLLASWHHSEAETARAAGSYNTTFSRVPTMLVESQVPRKVTKKRGMLQPYFRQGGSPALIQGPL